MKHNLNKWQSVPNYFYFYQSTRYSKQLLYHVEFIMCYTFWIHMEDANCYFVVDEALKLR